MALTISVFYWKLFPLIKKIDARNQLDPKDYSRTLGSMIGIFIAVFIAAIIVAVLFLNPEQL